MKNKNKSKRKEKKREKQKTKKRKNENIENVLEATCHFNVIKNIEAKEI